MTITTATYIVDRSADDLEGWTMKTLADALRAPLAEIGVRVETFDGITFKSGLSGADEATELAVERIVTRIVEG